MANIDADAILTRIRNVLEDGAGTLRTIAANTYDGGLYDGQSLDEASKRAATRPVSEASIVRIGRNEASPMWHSNLALYDIDVEVRVVRHVDHTHKADDALRDDIKALAANDADVIAQALTYLDNLDSATTSIVSGALRFEESEIEVELDDDEAPHINTVHRFSGIVTVAPATS